MLDKDKTRDAVESILPRSPSTKFTPTVHDRLCSIRADALFVETVRKSFALPVAVNERCGRWYVMPEQIAEAVYFKSTDGHTDHCKFSLRRLNIHVLPLIIARNGLIIVDSTRRGKRMPDALSKTIPIWCCVLNRIVARHFHKLWTSEQLALSTPSICVSRNEHEKIEAQINTFVESLMQAKMDMNLLQGLQKPLRPMWITPTSTLLMDTERFAGVNFLPLILVTASRAVNDGVDRQHGYTYVQGAADDEEMWAAGLKPDLFWGIHQNLLNAGASQFEEVLAEARLIPLSSTSSHARLSQVRDTSIYLCNDVHESDLDGSLIIDLSPITKLSASKKVRHLPMYAGKKGAAQLHSTFRATEDWIRDKNIRQNRIIITDDESCKTKASIIALFLLLIYYDDTDEIVDRAPTSRIDKDMVRDRLLTLVNSRAGLNPSRASLKSLNEYLMSGPFRANAKT